MRVCQTEHPRSRKGTSAESECRDGTYATLKRLQELAARMLCGQCRRISRNTNSTAAKMETADVATAKILVT